MFPFHLMLQCESCIILPPLNITIVSLIGCVCRLTEVKQPTAAKVYNGPNHFLLFSK